MPSVAAACAANGRQPSSPCHPHAWAKARSWGGVRLYSSGQPGGARSDRLLYQARLALDDDLRLKVVRKMYAMRFQEEPPARRSVDQLRGIEGARVRASYQTLARQSVAMLFGFRLGTMQLMRLMMDEFISAVRSPSFTAGGHQAFRATGAGVIPEVGTRSAPGLLTTTTRRKISEGRHRVAGDPRRWAPLSPGPSCSQPNPTGLLENPPKIKDIPSHRCGEEHGIPEHNGHIQPQRHKQCNRDPGYHVGNSPVTSAGRASSARRYLVAPPLLVATGLFNVGRYVCHH